MEIKLTKNAKICLDLAGKVAISLGSSIIGTEHVLYGLSANTEGIASKLLNKYGFSGHLIKQFLLKSNEKVQRIDFSDKVKSILKSINMEITTEALLFSIISGEKNVAQEILNYRNSNVVSFLINEMIKTGMITLLSQNGSLNVDKPNTFTTPVNNLKSAVSSSGSNNSLTELLNFGRDLTERAKQGKIDPIIGRDDETERVIEILLRKTKNNPCLIGEAGVGKSAIVEGLALRIVNNNVPQQMIGKTVFSLDVAALLAGTKYRGELEQRLKTLIDVLIKRDDIILFIDEIHTLITSGGKEGEVSASEILKPYLARGEMQTIGATTTDEYRKYIEKDKALERRFSPIIVNPPTVAQSIEILNGLKRKYEQFHGVEIFDDAITASVNLSERYITDRNLPDKAIDLLDEAASVAKISGEDFIDENNIAKIVSRLTKIPVTKLNSQQTSDLNDLEAQLKKRVIGQDKAVEAVAKAIKRQRAGISDPNKPIGSFMFLGRTGTGKTETCKAISELVFFDNNAFIRLDCSEFSEAHSVSKLIGAPAGYVGYEDGGGLTEQVRRKPYCLVLFDEIEKAHSDIYNLLLQVLDEGQLTDSHGRKVNFKNTIIVLTSNIGVDLLDSARKKNTIGFTDTDETGNSDYETDILMEGLKKKFKPEFINRIDNIVVFNSLSEADVAKIAGIFINKLNKKMNSVGISIKVTESAMKHIVKKGYSREMGARPLRRVISSEIEDKLAEGIISGEFDNCTVSIDYVDSKLVLLKI